MPQTIAVDKMSTAEKLETMEALWDGLCSNEREVPSPQWHGAELDERERMIERGEDQFVSLDEAKKRIEAMIK